MYNFFCTVQIILYKFYFIYICAMNVKEYLLSGKEKLSVIASLMYPNNSNAEAYLSRKLNEKDGRKFTKKDAELAIKVLKERCECVSKLTID